MLFQNGFKNANKYDSMSSFLMLISICIVGKLNSKQKKRYFSASYLEEKVFNSRNSQEKRCLKSLFLGTVH